MSAAWCSAVTRLGRAAARVGGPCLALALLYMGLPSTAGGQPSNLSLAGYAKNLAIVSESAVTGDPYLLDVTRFRLRAAMEPARNATVQVWLDSEMLTGSFLRSPDYARLPSIVRPGLVDLEWTIIENDDIVARQKLFRAFGSVFVRGAQVTAGRQRVAWGSGFVWTPTDVLNPQDPAAIERDERDGVDALYAFVPAGKLQLEGALVPGRSRSRSAYGGRIGTNVRTYDIRVMGGYFRETWVAGMDFAGYIGNAGFRGESTVTFEGGREYVRLVLNADYNFPGNIYAFVELYHNGRGSRSRAGYDPEAALAAGDFNLAQNYVAVTAGNAISPIVGGSIYAIVNLDDGSALVGPAFSWAVLQNLELAVSTYLLVGPSSSEFGGGRNVYFGSLQYFF